MFLKKTDQLIYAQGYPDDRSLQLQLNFDQKVREAKFAVM